MFPKFPTDEKGIRIAENNFDGHNNAEDWHVFAGKIQRKIKWYFEEGINEEKIRHLSVFAIGPMPLLDVLGESVLVTLFQQICTKHTEILMTQTTLGLGQRMNEKQKCPIL